MKNMFLGLALVLVSSSSFAAQVKTLCGAGDDVRVAVVLNAANPFSDPVVETVNDQTPRTVEGSKAHGFGPHGYENIELNLNGCAGTASYDQYNSNFPMNPMQKIDLKCICN